MQLERLALLDGLERVILGIDLGGSMKQFLLQFLFSVYFAVKKVATEG